MAAEQLAVARARKRIFYVCIEQCSNVSTRKKEKTCEKMLSASEMTYIVSSGALNSTHSLTLTAPQTHVSEPSVRVNWRLYCETDVTWMRRARVKLTADWKVIDTYVHCVLRGATSIRLVLVQCKPNIVVVNNMQYVLSYQGIIYWISSIN